MIVETGTRKDDRGHAWGRTNKSKLEQVGKWSEMVQGTFDQVVEIGVQLDGRDRRGRHRYMAALTGWRRQGRLVDNGIFVKLSRNLT